MGSVTSTGYVPVKLDDWISRFETLFRRVYGADIDLSAKSADGQMVGILAQMFADQDEQVAILFSMLDPNQASGVYVDQFLAYVALQRKGEMSTLLTKVKIEGDRNTIIRTPYYVTDSSNNVYQLNSTVALDDNGVVETSFSSVKTGRFVVLANDELKPQTIVSGVRKVTNMQVSSGGASTELDSEAIDRAYASYGKPGTNSIDGIVAEIRQMTDVIACNGYENEEDTRDPLTGLPPHSMQIVVDGGSPAAIADCIFRRKTNGCKQIGTVSYQITDKSGTQRTMKWSQPTYVEAYASLVVARKELFTDVSEELIKNAILSKVYNIGEEVSTYELGQLIQEANGVSPNFYIKTFFVGKSANPSTDTILRITALERAIFAADRITIAVVNADG
ncbi:hypothetical protein XK44_003674 [Salmonella enterica subsp. enterica]|nr:hypothetical protein [Salmonella enterica subsp. enterica]